MKFSLDDKVFAILLVPIIITLLGNLLFFIISAKRRSVFYSSKHNYLSYLPFSRTDLEITHIASGTEIAGNLAKLKMIIVNNKNKVTKKEDLAKPFEIVFSGRILSLDLMRRTNDTISIHQNGNTVTVLFDYLKRGDGVVFEADIDSYQGYEIENPFLDLELKRKPMDSFNPLIKKAWLGIIGPNINIIALRIMLTIVMIVMIMAMFMFFDYVRIGKPLYLILYLAQVFIATPMYFIFMYKSYNIPLIKKELYVFFE